MTGSNADREALPHHLTDEERDRATSGMKWQSGTRNPGGIDARGGQIGVLGWTFTLDVNGTVSSATFG